MAIEEINIEELAVKLETGEPLTAIEVATVAGLVRIAAKTLAGASKGGKAKRKFKSDKDRYDFHNRKRKEKRKADREAI